MTDQPLLLLPPWRGPAFHIDSLERVAQRETCRLGIFWADLSLREKNEWMLYWAQTRLLEAVNALNNDRGFSELLTKDVVQAAIIDDAFGADALLHWLNLRHRDLECVFLRIGRIRDALEGRVA